MRSEIVGQFPIDPSLVLLNHASFGLPTTALMDAVERTRRRIERDAAGTLDGPYLDQLREQLAEVAGFLDCPARNLALVANATEASSAIAASLCRDRAQRAVMLDTEYSSVVRAWQIASGASGGSVQLVHVDAPVSGDQAVLEALDGQVDAEFDVLVISLVTSSTALLLPVDRIAAWAATRGARTIVDAAHGPGHVDVPVAGLGAAAVFGTLHKWLPVPRPVGFLYLRDDLLDLVRPAGVALRWDEGLAERFAWRGTWDPAPALCVGAALAEWRRWDEDGLLADARRLADAASTLLTRAGLPATGDASLWAPRLRAFEVPHRSPDEVRAALADAGVRAWVGTSGARATVLRVATHVFTTDDDLRRVANAVAV